MKYLALLFVLFSGLCYAEGTHTAAMVKALDTDKEYLKVDKLITENVIDDGKEKVCLVITDSVNNREYMVTDEKEIILLLIDMIKDLDAKIKAK